MKSFLSLIAASSCLIASLIVPAVQADDSYTDALKNFNQAKETRKFFDTAYGYALFPTVGKGGFGIGAAYGKGRVFRAGQYMGDASLTQLSIGFQLGGQAYSEIIFFKNAKAYNEL